MVWAALATDRRNIGVRGVALISAVVSLFASVAAAAIVGQQCDISTQSERFTEVQEMRSVKSCP